MARTPAALPRDMILWEWIRVVRRAELGFGTGKQRVSTNVVQQIAVIVATYGNPDGTSIRPSHERIARVCRRDITTVRDALHRLVEVGLLVLDSSGSAAGRVGLASVYHLAIPEDLMDRVPMLDPDERELIVPEGADPPPAKKRRARTTSAAAESAAPETPGAAPGDEGATAEPENAPQGSQEGALKGSPEPGTPGAAPSDVDGTPGAAPCDYPVENPVDNPGTPGAAPGDTAPDGKEHRGQHQEHRGQHPRTPGAAPHPPTQDLHKYLPYSEDISPYGADVEGGRAARREPSAKPSIAPSTQPTGHPSGPPAEAPPKRRPVYRQSPLMAVLPDPPPDELDAATYAAARDALAALPDLGHALIASARAEHPDAPLAHIVVEAAALHRRPA